MQPILNELICGDNIKVLKGFESNCIDLTVTSPPYDDIRNYNGYSFDFEEVSKQLYRVTKDGGVVVWVVGDAVIKGSESGTSFKQALHFKEIGFRLHDTMIFEKNASSLPDPTRYNQRFQYMFVFSKGKPKTFNSIKDNLNKHAGALKTHCSVREKDGKLYSRKNRVVANYSVRPNIWRYTTGWMTSTSDKIAFQHPAIFPDKLAYDHIISWSNKGDVILDPFVGSGTTCKMAKQLGRNYIGIDISQEYIDIAKKRLNI